jgi:uracil-DNA glycosylase family protein
MTETQQWPGAEPFVPTGAGWETLRAAAERCQGCDLHLLDNRMVFGEGPLDAAVVLVGEQPGDIEDRQGRPFVGPAGRVLDRALAEVGIERERAYVTNAVKHFKFTGSTGKRRIHATPDAIEVAACKPWLQAELTLLDPVLVVSLGATAGSSLFGRGFRVTRERGTLRPWPGRGERDGDEDGRHAAYALATIHPSAVLRAPDQDAAFAGLVSDLAVGASVLG